jgi:hypothetical protein
VKWPTCYCALLLLPSPEVPASTRNLLPCQQRMADWVLAQLSSMAVTLSMQAIQVKVWSGLRQSQKHRTQRSSTVNRRPTDMCLKVNMRVTGFVANCAVDDTNAAYDQSSPISSLKAFSSKQRSKRVIARPNACRIFMERTFFSAISGHSIRPDRSEQLCRTLFPQARSAGKRTRWMNRTP